MTIRTRLAALAVADKTKTNIPGRCQEVTRGYFNAPSVGDFDGDGAADAEDGWKSEPLWARHTDRNPPAGVPVTFGAGGNDFWHRAISRGKGQIRSTDFNGVTKRYEPGVVGNGTIAQVSAAMGRPWIGWSDTIDGNRIPEPKPLTRGWRIERALRLARNANPGKPGSKRSRFLNKVKVLLGAIPKDR